MAGIELRSQAFADHENLPPRHTRDGENVSPPLQWSGVPDGTRELLVLCEDPDAPGGTFLHWLVTGVDPRTEGVAAGGVPNGGKQWRNDFGERRYGGPRPPRGSRHRYVFHVYALAAPVRLSAAPTADEVHRAVHDVSLASGTTVAIYQR